MNIKAIIFDLDQTLVNTDEAKPLRDSRKWAEVYAMIPQLLPFPGIHEVIKIAKEKNIITAIVTSSPRQYCEKIINHWGIDVDYTVCYRDTAVHKPEAEPILKAIELIGNVDKNQIISIGDDPNDIKASKKAGVISAGALWGTNKMHLLIKEYPDYIFTSVDGLKQFLTK